MRYPKAEWIPWGYNSANPSYYKGHCGPIACVLHVAQGWHSTALEWAKRGHHRASRTFSIGLNGHVAQHLEFNDGGYHAGISYSQGVNYPPTWKLWKGPSSNVNFYTLGIEHEGFYKIPAFNGFGQLITDNPMHKIFSTKEQREASKELCYWLADHFGWPIDDIHFPPHADIDLINRPNDFATPADRAFWYQELMRKMDEKERTIMYKVFDLVLGDPPANTSDANAWRVARAIELADTQDFDVFKLIARQNDVMHAMQDKIKKLEERNQLRGEFDIEGVIRFMEDDE